MSAVFLWGQEALESSRGCEFLLKPADLGTSRAAFKPEAVAVGSLCWAIAHPELSVAVRVLQRAQAFKVIASRHETRVSGQAHQIVAYFSRRRNPSYILHCMISKNMILTMSTSLSGSSWILSAA